MTDDAMAQVILSEMSLRGRLPGMRAMGLDVGGTNVGLAKNLQSIAAGDLLEGFEGVSTVSPAVPSGWSIGLPGGGTLEYSGHTSWFTQGAQSYRLYNRATSGYQTGGTLALYRNFDFTNIDKLVLDINLSITSSVAGYASAAIKVGGSTVYSKTDANPPGIVTGLEIDTRSFSGVQELRFEATQSGANATRTIEFRIDNIRTGESFGYLLKQLTRLNLDRITFPKIYKPANTKCQVDVLGASVRANTAVSGGNDYIDLDAGASVADDFYNGKTIILKTGTGAGQVRTIVDYVGSSKRAFVTGENWILNPASGTTYEVFDTIVRNISPGYDFSTIDYTVCPTVNVICSLEKQAGATASPSMGVPIVTSIENGKVKMATGVVISTTYATALLVERCQRLNCLVISGKYLTSSTSISLRLTVDGATVYDGPVTEEFASGLPMMVVTIPVNIEAATFTVELSNNRNSTARVLAIYE